MTIFYVMCGTSGSGKTFEAKKLVKMLGPDTEYISSDELREELGVDEGDQSVNHYVFWVIQEHLALTQADFCVVDVTNAAVEDRRKLLSCCKGVTILVWMDTPLNLCLTRQFQRERYVPAEAIRKMHARIQESPPSEADGASQVIRIC